MGQSSIYYLTYIIGSRMRVDFYLDKDLDEPRVVVQAPCRTEEIDDIMEMILSYTPASIVGYLDGVVYRLNPSDIIRIRSMEKKVYADTSDGTFLIRSALYQLEESLPTGFVRISNSEIVNSDRILRMDLSLSGTIVIKLEGGMESRVSRRYVPKVRRALE